MLIKQLSVFIENRMGRLADITAFLAENNVNIRALSIADTTSFGILRIIVDEPNEVEELLKKKGVAVSVTSVLSVRIEDKPGGLASVLSILAKENIQVEYMYAFISKKADTAYVVLRIEEDLKAQQILTENGYAGLNDSLQ